MAQDKSHIKSSYPLPAYNYRVTIFSNGEALVLGFAEVAGLAVEYEPVTYKHGLSFALGDQIILGMRQPIRLTMKRGIVQRADDLAKWFRSTHAGPALIDPKRDIRVDLCDEAGAAVVRWTVQGALPIKLEAPTFDANSDDVAIETMELVAQNLQVDYAP